MNPRLTISLTIGALTLLFACAPLSQETATIQARLNVQGFKTQGAPATTADVDHYTYQLRDNGTNALIASYQSSATSLTFTGVPGGTFKLTAEAFSSHSDATSITVGGAQTSSNTVTVSGGGVSYSSGSALAATLNLLPGDGDTVAAQVAFNGNQGDLDHFTYELVRTSDQSVAASFDTLLTSLLFDEIDSGTYWLRGEAFDAGSTSISHKSLSSNTVTVSPSGVTYSSGSNLLLTVMGIINQWTTGYDEIPNDRIFFGAGVYDEAIYAVGGFNSGTGYSPHMEQYNTNNDTWDILADLPTARTELATEMAGGMLYAIGGRNGSWLQTVEEYDPDGNTWATMANMPTARSHLAAGAIAGKIYAIGGTPDGTGTLNTVQEYDPSGNTWAAKANMPTARRGLAVAVVGSKLYAIGGFNAGSLSTVEEYDPAANTWAAKASMPTARMDLAVGVANGKIYAVGGQGAGSVTEEYDPVANTWATKANMPTGRYGLAIGVVNNFLYALGGQGGDVTVERYEP